jgi:hypothetical protein
LALASISVPFVPPETTPPCPVFGTLVEAVCAPVLELFGPTDWLEPARLALARPENPDPRAFFRAFGECEAVLPSASTTAEKGEVGRLALWFPDVTAPGAAIAAPPIARATTNKPSGDAPTVLVR